MLRFLSTFIGVAAKTALGLLAIVLGIWFLGLCLLSITWLARNTPYCESFVLGGLTSLVLFTAYKLGEVLWRLLN